MNTVSGLTIDAFMDKYSANVTEMPPVDFNVIWFIWHKITILSSSENVEFHLCDQQVKILLSDSAVYNTMQSIMLYC